MTRLAIIADDVTGAGDSGIHFAKTGRTTALQLQPDPSGDIFSHSEVVALSTESRFMEPEAAAKTVRDAVASCVACGCRHFYKKIDSTMRGNPGGETAAALETSGLAAALVCPAMPKLDRICQDGILLLRGVPLHETDIGADPFTPVTSSSIQTILAAQTDLPMASLRLVELRAGRLPLRQRVQALLDSGCRVIVADAVTDDDLRILGELFAPAEGETPLSLLPVGAGGLAEALARATQRQSHPAPKADITVQGPCGRMLAVVGSLARASREQAAHACECGVFHPLDMDVAAALVDPERECTRILALAAQGGSKHLLLRSDSGPVDGHLSREQGTLVARIMGDVAAAICRAQRCQVLYATGGSTAIHLSEALSLPGVTLEQELLPGVVLGTCRAQETDLRWFITKAGGFGNKETLATLADRLNKA